MLDDREAAYSANVLGALVTTLAERLGRASSVAADGHSANAPAALVSLLWYPGRPIQWLAARLDISHPGAVQLTQRLESAGLLRRVPGRSGRTRQLSLTAAGEAAARKVLRARAAVLADALEPLDHGQVRDLTAAVELVLSRLSSGLLESERVCRLCDESSCPDVRCPGERAAPSPVYRRGTGWGVGTGPDDEVTHNHSGPPS